MWFFILILIIIAIALFMLADENKILIVYAGKPEREKYDKFSSTGFENTDFVCEDDVIIDKHKYRVALIKGNSLKPEGVVDGSILFVKIITWWKRINTEKCLNLIQSKNFIILRNDAKRAKKEHPEREVLNGLKLRQFIQTVDTNLDKMELDSIIQNDYDNASDEFKECIWCKYEFARKYYKDTKLILSKTYKNGNEKDLSFHSVKFLRGIAAYIEKKNEDTER